MVLVGALYSISLIIGNILALALPSKLASFAGVHERVHHWLHALCIRRVGLHEVDEVQSIRLIFARILNSEVEPLGETLCTIVVFEV